MKSSNKLAVALLVLASLIGCETCPGEACQTNDGTDAVAGKTGKHDGAPPGYGVGPMGTRGTTGCPNGEPGVDGNSGLPAEFSVERGTFALSDEEIETLLAHFGQKAEEATSQPATPEVWASEAQCQSAEDCDDDQGCTTDTCDGGFCSHATVEGCKPCKTHADCKADKVCNGSSVGMLLYSCEEDSTCQPSMGVGQFCNQLCTSEPEVACIDACQTDADCGGANPCMKNTCNHSEGAGNYCRYNEPIEGCVPEE